MAPRDPALLAEVEFAALAADRPVRPLLLQALLQLPRLADAHGFVPLSAVKELLAELVQELPAKEEWLVPAIASSPRALRVRPIDWLAARRVMQDFHYLRSPRREGRAYGLCSDSDRLIALCVSSILDVERLLELLSANGRSNANPRVISRVFAFEGAPPNSISYILSRVARQERERAVTDFVTYVNPNMAFHGSSYRASGWKLLGSENGTAYRYLDGRYITDRELAARFGAHSDEGYTRLLGSRFTRSIMPLEPLLVFHATLAANTAVTARSE